VLENGEDPEVHLTIMPSFNNKRFETQSELAFHVCSYFNGVMKHAPDIHLEDPDYEANQLLVNACSLCNTTEVRSPTLHIALHTPHPTRQCPTHQPPIHFLAQEGAVIARAVQFAHCGCLTRFVFQKKGFINLAESRAMTLVQIGCLPLWSSLATGDLEGMHKRFSQCLGPARAATLQRAWEALSVTRGIMQRRAQMNEHAPHVKRFLVAGTPAAVAKLQKHLEKYATGIKCQKNSPMYNMFNESAFGALAEAQNGKKSGINRSRGNAVSMINGTVACELQLQGRVTKDFNTAVRKGEQVADDPPEHRRKKQRTNSLMNLFNTKHVPVQQRRVLMSEALKNTGQERTKLKGETEAQTQRKMDLMEQTSSDARTRCEKRMKSYGWIGHPFQFSRSCSNFAGFWAIRTVFGLVQHFSQGSTRRSEVPHAVSRSVLRSGLVRKGGAMIGT
jgi:hypothetical protein